MASRSDDTPLVVIVGETASGKSALALELAEQFGGEIICADSWTVYSHFDIGTAKPSPEERAKIHHQLLDVADPNKGFSAVEFQRLAKKAIDDIASRGKLPIMVGGTGLYIDSVIYDYSFLPPSSPEQRRQLNTLTLTELHTTAKELGLDTTGIDMRNKRRVIRLIENNGVRPTRHKLRPDTLLIGLSVPRDELRNRITERVDKMLRTGLEDEAADLAKRYGWEAEPMKGIGYREWQSYFAGEQTLEQTRLKIISSSLSLAKKQRTWFKRNKSIQWVDDRIKAVDLVTTFLNN
ncbi:MAG TPA: tRNA (adenosine(37)-N6)-dimethylallyltransferase MiaA [Candidatus Saccharimonadales bacterium]|nr:tRNA (adenosine(37)-N6)-dimethylallyltransferase MiaA [Candidatus Saccharimonadales bacterium]